MDRIKEANGASGGMTERPPRAQVFLDDIVLLLLAGLILPSLVFLGWGVVSLMSVPALVP